MTMYFKNRSHSLIFSLFLLFATCHCAKQDDYTPLANSPPEAKKAFVVLKGYLKRRDMAVTEADVAVKVTDTTILFRCQLGENEKYFTMQAKNKAWQIKETPPGEVE